MEQTIPIFIASALGKVWNFIELWWWVPMPFVLWRPFLFFWRWWRMETWMFAQKKVLLEIKMPKEVLKPLKAMEQVFSAIWGNTFDPPDWYEYWFEGKDLDSVQLEMVSLGGEPHLFVRCSEGRRNAIEASIYSQYPEAEILQADDYIKYVPQDLPNKDWEMWGTDYILQKSDVFPIKTYSKFFEEQESIDEEKRVDPLATLLEGMAKLGPGEQLWIQIAASPVLSVTDIKAGGTYDFVKEGRKVADKLAKREAAPKQKPILTEIFEEVVYGKAPGPEEKKVEIFPAELRLTPGEKDVVEAVENKVAKRCFMCFARFIYLAKRDVYFGGAKAIPFGFFNQFATENLNSPRPYPQTLTKIKHYITFINLPIPISPFRLRRLFVRKRKLFFRYIKRFPPLFPKSSGKTSFILNTEELATIFHFPGRMVAPAPFVSRVESKRGEAPPGLPMEE
ncbi:MAG: hypothetical protein HYV47_00610 [Candidatus Nealsonbacteria bacterium]|nr:hypothetical protein [Candidatus Nealsonbacteria bacterium]